MVWLVGVGRAEATAAVLGACALIVGGAVLATRDLWQRDRRVRDDSQPAPARSR